MGHKWKRRPRSAMSALPSTADMFSVEIDVFFVPRADIGSWSEGNSAAKISVVLGNVTFPERAVAAPDRFIAWCKQEQASIEQQLELLRAGKVRTGEDIGAGWIDTTEESERAKGRLAELNDLLTEDGTSTVVKPGAL